MNIQNSEVDVLVVGAGPTGLTMACELLRRGITCRILDKAAAPGMTSRAVGVQTRTLEVFDRMGIIEEVLARGVAGVCLNIYERDTRLLRMNFRFLASDAIPGVSISNPAFCTLSRSRGKEFLFGGAGSNVIDPYPNPACLARSTAWARSTTCSLLKMFET